ncbi:MAG: aldo/keto reductase, partial [Desulfurococcales archaeon]|nr:aldo/keto reductase [Desulfurococcales archaeon]
TPSSIEGGVRKINERLGFRLDLIQHHWPPPFYAPLCGVIRGLERSVEKGMAWAYGLSNYHAELVEEALYCSKKIEPVSNQVQYSLAYRSPEKKLIPLMEKTGMTLIAWSPLAKGALAGARVATSRAQKGDPVFRVASKDEALLRAVRELAEKHSASMAQIALAWLVARGAVPIPGARRPERVAEYAGSASIRLGEQDLRLLDQASSRYLSYWGDEYRFTPMLRAVPGFLVRLLIVLGGGI